MSQHDEHTNQAAHPNHGGFPTTEHDHAAMSHEHGASQEHAGQEGHGGHAGHADHVGQFRRLFWIMLVLAVPVVGFSMMFSMLLGYPLPDAAWVGWISPVLGTVMYVWGGAPFLTGAVSELRARKHMKIISLAPEVL